MPKAKTVFSLESQPHLEGPGYPKIIDFRCFFRVGLKYLPRGRFGEHFRIFIQILDDFGIPIGLPLGTIFPQKVDSETESKKR